MNENLKSLKYNVWMTRKARINASERLLYLEKFIQYVNIYYSCFLCILSVYGLTTTNYKIGIISAIISIILTILIVYLNSQKFGDRAQQLKSNYIDLQKLYFKLNNIDENATSLIQYQNEYAELLSNCENHSSHDYYKILLREKQIDTISKLGLIYYTCKIFRWFCSIIVLIIPITLLLYIFI
ncbi:hypothetical protein SAMN02910355_1731 [Terrisporobacter glycolicus]|nr:hypothetical protein SAMN02910355_1731 [Terrisporobacter glycolicus]